MGQKELGKLCCVNGRYRRTIGRFINAEGKISPKKFLLGTDKNLAETANLRLVQLWREVVAATTKDNAERLGGWQKAQEVAGRSMVAASLVNPNPPRMLDPYWMPETLFIAEAIRKGQTQINVTNIPLGTDKPDNPYRYGQRLARLQADFTGVEFVPTNKQLLATAKEGARSRAELHAAQAQVEAAQADIAIPTGTGQTLYQAIDAFIAFVKVDRVKEGKPTEWGRVLAGNVLATKRSIKDVPLSRFGFTQIEEIKRFWAKRPNRKGTKRPIAVDSVKGQMKALKLFLQWLHRNPDWKWRKPEDYEDAISLDYANLMTNDEIAGLKNGVQTYTIEELAILWRYATDHVRVFMILGLNCGFARAECSSLRLDEIHLGDQPPTIKRVRRKSKVYGEFTLWTETIKALTWASSMRPASKEPYAILTAWNHPYTGDAIANLWNGTLNAITREHPDFRRLGFKYLRKSAAQLVRQVSDGETTGVFLCHGSPVRTDELSDAYSRRDFGKVFDAQVKVRDMLSSVFNGIDAFTGGGSRHGGPRVPRVRSQNE